MLLRRQARPFGMLLSAMAFGLAGQGDARAQTPWSSQGGASDRAWSARWIAAPQDQWAPNRWHALRYVVEIPVAPSWAPLRVAASDKYWLWINGRMVVFEGGLKRGPNPTDGYYDTLDIAPYLESGSNTIAALVWFWGRSGYSHRTAHLPGFLFEADVGGQTIESGADWRALVLPAYEMTEGGIQPNAALTEHNVRYDARKEISGWQEPGFSDADWPMAVEQGVPPTEPWNDLFPRPIPLWRDSGLREYESLAGVPSGTGGGVVSARLPYNAQVTPYLKVEAIAGQTIHIKTDNHETSGAPSLRAEYVTREGMQEYESYGWLSGHEVLYTIPPGVRVVELKYRETGYDTDFVGRFDSDDPALNTLWIKARRTLYVSMRDHQMSDPDRERAQWWGDLVNALGQVFYALDAERGPLLAGKAVRELAAWQREDKALVTLIPYGQGYDSPEIPIQLMASVGRYGFWEYYLYTGDARTLQAAYPAVRDYLQLWSMGSDGLVVHRPGDWTWPDWGDHADYEVLENAWYYLALEGAAKIADVVGQEADIPFYGDRMESIRGAFRDRFWRGDHFESPGHRGAVDDRANAMAILAGFSEPDDRLALREVLARERHSSPFMERFVLEALFALDDPEGAMDRMRQRYRPMIDNPITTLWEGWEMATWWGYNHAWAGGPLTLLSRYAAGVAPAAPGWERFQVFPQMGSLNRIDAVVPTPLGSITVALERDEDRLDLRVDAPMGGTVGIPRSWRTIERVSVNGVDRWREGKPVEDSTLVRIDGSDERWLQLEVPPGSWSIQALSTRESLFQPDEVFTLSENPVRSRRVIFHFRDEPELAGVYALDGRRVVDLLGRRTDPGRSVWDLTNDRGGRVAPGIYIVVAKVGDTVVRSRLLIAR